MLRNNNHDERSFEGLELEDKCSNDEVGSEELTSQQMLELAHNHQKFMTLLSKLLSIAQECIGSNNAQEGIEYLVQGEKILEYAASCGKNIDRNLILSVIHNEAYGYQRMWELPKCSNYLEAVIYNMYGKFSAVETPISFHPSLEEDGFPIYDIAMQSTINPSDLRFLRRIDNNQKMKLCKYHLQFSAVNSQLKNHRKAADSSNSALTLIKEIFNTSKNITWHKSSTSLSRNSEYPSLTSLVTKGIANIELKPILSHYVHYKKLMRFLQTNWESRVIKNQQNSNSPYNQVYEYIKSFTIGTIMQMKAYSVELQQYQSVKFSNEDYTIESCQVSPLEPTYQKTLQQVLYLCSCLFTYSTEQRLSLRMRNDNNRFKAQVKDIQVEKKEAQINHLLSIIIYYIYVPFRLDFIGHLQVSYKKNYNDTQGNLFYGEITQQMLTSQELGLLNALDTNYLRNYQYEKTDEPVAVQKRNSSPQDTPKKNSMVRKLQSKCKKIITEKYNDDMPLDQVSGSKSKNKLKKVVTLNNTRQNHSSTKSYANMTSMRKTQITPKSKNKKKSAGKSRPKKFNERIHTQGHDSIRYCQDWTNNDYEIFSNTQINLAKKEGIAAGNKTGDYPKKGSSSCKTLLKNQKIKSKQKIAPFKLGQDKKKRKINIRELGVTITSPAPKKVSKNKANVSTKKNIVPHTSSKKLVNPVSQNKRDKDKNNFTCNYGL